MVILHHGESQDVIRTEDLFTWASATPIRGRQRDLCVMGRVGCSGSGRGGVILGT